MAAASSEAWDLGPGLFGLGGLGEVLDRAERVFGAMSGARSQGARRSPEDPGCGPRGPGRGQWGGGLGGFGFGGPAGGWWPGFPGSARSAGGPGGSGAQQGPKAGRGDVRAAILAVLRDGPRNGYQIMSEIEERSGGAWRPSPGAVYPALSQLADEGLISGEESAGRRTFSLTDDGRAYVTEHPEMARGAWEDSAQQEAWQLPGLFAVAARLGGGIVQVAHAGTPGQIRAAERLLDQTRRRLYQILADDLSGEQGERDED
jgi:DNA-binding PadR family transcriptional regulator